MTSDARIVANLLSGKYDWVGEERESYCVSYTDKSSIGNRYINWHGLWVFKEVDEENPLDGNIIDAESAHDHIKEFDWRVVFALIEYGIFVGPTTQEALLDCVKLIKDTVLPEEGGPKFQVPQRLCYAYVTKRTQAEWELQSKVRSRMLAGFSADLAEKNLLSDSWVYMTRSRCGWSRST